MKRNTGNASGSKYCARCGRGPLKNPYEVNGQTFGSICRNKVLVQRLEEVTQ